MIDQFKAAAAKHLADQQPKLQAAKVNADAHRNKAGTIIATPMVGDACQAANELINGALR